MNQRWTGYLVALSAVVLAACSNDVVAPLSQAPRASVNTAVGDGSGNYLVLLRNSTAAKSVSAKVEALGGKISFMHEGAGILGITGVTDAAVSRLTSTAGVQEIKANPNVSLEQPLQAVNAAMPDVTIESQSNPATAILGSWQWNMADIHANTAWSAGKLGNAGITVAIIDSGIDYSSPDLNGLVDLTRSASFVPSDDSIATAFFPTRNKITDFNGHGTNVATQVSSKAFAFAGVTSRTTLIGVKVIGRTGSGPLGNILMGILWAADHGANVANMSIGGAFDKAGAQGLGGFLNRVINYANKSGMLIVAAAGNSSTNFDFDGSSYSTWCSAPHVVCVSAVGPTTATGSLDTFATYSNFGRSAISVAAPGGNQGVPPVVSNWPWGAGNISLVWSLCARDLITGLTSAGVPVTPCSTFGIVIGAEGTSQASPHVSGLAALIMAENPGMSADDVKDLILNSADDLGQSGVDPFYGHGRINVARALGL